MKFDIIEGILITALNNPAKDRSAVIMANTARIALGVFQKAPKFRISDINALKELMRDNISAEELIDITRYLPFTSFSIVEPDVTTFVISGNAVDPSDAACTWTFIQMLDQPIDRGALMFYPHFLTLDDDGNSNVTWVDPSDTPDYSTEAQESANNMLLHVTTLLCTLSVFSKQIITIRAPDRLIKKRAKNGKFPLYEYRIISLDRAIIPILPVKYRNSITGRLPPRTHLRRGHWATRNDSRYFRRSCIVNAKVQHTRGRIAKDYDIE